MKCPVCQDSSLVMADRQGIEIDYCPQCRGVWLDRGELDKIIERTDSAGGRSEAGRTQHESRDSRDRRDDRDDDDDNYFGSRTGKKKKRGLLGDLFEF